MNSTVVTKCQICGSPELESVLNLGYLPPVNTMQKIGSRLEEQPFFPTELLQCRSCGLVQLGVVVDSSILFPPTYSYRSGTTKALRDNFVDLAKECVELGYGKPTDLVVDVGSNDGSLLQCFKLHGLRVYGVEPTDAGRHAEALGISVYRGGIETLPKTFGCLYKAKIVTACNVFAHTPDPYEFIECVKDMLAPDGTFVVEVQDVSCLQYDTVYHEHLRYYSFVAMHRLLHCNDMKVVGFKKIETHGGSMRIYAARKADPRPETIVGEWTVSAAAIAKRTMRQKLELLSLLSQIKKDGQQIYGIGCPSRAVTLIHYVGLEGIIDCVCEIAGSPKIGHYVPGTAIPVIDESKLLEDQPRFALLLSWHLADGLMKTLTEKGFRGQYIIPLPEPRIV